MTEPQFSVVARMTDLAPGEVRHVELAGQEIAVFNVDGEFFATSDRCTHMRARLSDGYVNAGVVECPLHFGKFNIRTGHPLSPPCKLSLATYPVQVRDNCVWVGVPSIT